MAENIGGNSMYIPASSQGTSQSPWLKSGSEDYFKILFPYFTMKICCDPPLELSQ